MIMVKLLEVEIGNFLLKEGWKYLYHYMGEETAEAVDYDACACTVEEGLWR